MRVAGAGRLVLVFECVVGLFVVLLFYECCESFLLDGLGE